MSGVRSLPGPPMKALTIRKATLKDIDQFYPFFKKCIKENFPQYTQNVSDFYLEVDYSEMAMRTALLEKKETLYLAFHKSILIGLLLTQKVYGGVCWAIWLAVDSEFQNLGCASSLLSLWEHDVLKDGGHMVHLWTSKNNIPFYTKRGFTLMGEYPQSWFGLDSYFFYKTLAPAEEKNYLREYLSKKKINNKKRNEK
jgi:ribosomal protein S18 acetylase RimI-like enzyme